MLWSQAVWGVNIKSSFESFMYTNWIALVGWLGICNLLLSLCPPPHTLSVLPVDVNTDNWPLWTFPSPSQWTWQWKNPTERTVNTSQAVGYG